MLGTIAQFVLSLFWLNAIVPGTYFGMIFISEWYPLALVPLGGLIGLVGGTLATCEPHRHRLLKRLCISVGASHLLILIAAIFRGRVPIADISSLEAFLYAFVVLQGVYSLVVAIQFRRHILAAVGMMGFAVSYSLATGFIAGMAFTNSWI